MTTFIPEELADMRLKLGEHFYYGNAKDTSSRSLAFPLELNDPSVRNQTIYIQTPFLFIPFGLNSYKQRKDSVYQKYSLNVSLRNPEDNQKVEMLQKFLTRLDNWIDKTVTENAEEWDISLEDKRHYSLVCTHEKAPPFLQLKLPEYKGVFHVELTTANGDVLDSPTVEQLCSHVEKQSYARFIIELMPVWTNAVGWGSSLRVKKIQVLNKYATKANVQFRDN